MSLAGFVLSRRAAADAVLNQLAEVVPVYKNELHEALGEIIRRRRLSGLLGTGILLVFASQLFASIRLVLNDIFGFTKGTGFLRGALKDIILLFLMGVMFLASILVFDIFGWIRILLLAPLQIRAEWIRSLSLALALAFSSTFFFIAYRYFPHRKIPAGAALAGALLAAVLFEAALSLVHPSHGRVRPDLRTPGRARGHRHVLLLHGRRLHPRRRVCRGPDHPPIPRLAGCRASHRDRPCGRLMRP